MPVDESLAKTYYQVGIKEHADTRSMWMGTREKVTEEVLIMDNSRLLTKEVSYSPALFKAVDELLVNVSDQHSRMAKKTGRFQVRTLDVVFDQATGYITVSNDGQGMPVGVVRNKAGVEMYVPQLVTCEFLAGSNHEQKEGNVSGGVNCVGVKLTNNMSSHFILDTVDLERNLKYHLECHDRIGRIDEPAIEKRKGRPGGTTISFKPDLKALPGFTRADFGTFDQILRARVQQMAAFMPTVRVTYNGDELVNKNLGDFAQLLIPSGKFERTLIKHPKRPWEVVVGVSDTGSEQSMSLVNGIHVSSGTHLNHIRNQLIAALKPKAESLLKKYTTYKRSILTNNLYLIMSGHISNPSFSSQTKDKISNAPATYKDYTLSKTFANRVWKIFGPHLLSKYTGEKSKTKGKAKTAGIPKYVRARWAGTAKAEQCSLLLAEGDSAATMLHTALTSKKVGNGGLSVPFNYEYYGTFNLNGVTMNSRKKATVLSVDAAGKRNIVREKKLIDCERLSSFAKACNLEYNKTYSTAKERSTLSYGKFILATDQDHDGVGNILGLFMSHVELFWPELIKAGYLSYVATPIVRAYPKAKNGTGINFYSDEEYRKWKAATPDLSKWNIGYYKGLATHSDRETVHIFQNLKSTLWQIDLDKDASDTLTTYYGKDPDKRKAELSQPPTDFGEQKDMITNVSRHLRTYTRSYQLDNISRKIPHVNDGLMPARRKVLYAAIRRFMTNNVKTRVFELGGYVAFQMSYHHGSDSLNDTIVNMAQTYVGANNIPLLLPHSQFGTRFRGGKDAGSPRYIKTNLNRDFVKAAFRAEDEYILEFSYDEGVRREPLTFIPVVPTILLESLEVPATGWRTARYARDFDAVIQAVLSLIGAIDLIAHIRGLALTEENMPELEKEIMTTTIKLLPFWKREWKGDIRRVPARKRGPHDRRHRRSDYIEEWSVGKYDWEGARKVRITELPYMVWNEAFTTAVAKKAGVSKIRDNSGKMDIDITITFNAAGMEALAEAKATEHFDDVEVYLNLKNKLGVALNFVDGRGDVVSEYDCYEDVLRRWFANRLLAYIRRFAHMRVLLGLQIRLLEESTLFVQRHDEFEFSTIDRKEADELLEEAGFQKFNKGLLDNPESTPTADLESAITQADNCSYAYLYAIGPLARMKKARDARAARLARLKKKLADMTSARAELRAWKDEIAEVVAVVAKARASQNGWLYSSPARKL